VVSDSILEYSIVVVLAQALVKVLAEVFGSNLEYSIVAVLLLVIVQDFVHPILGSSPILESHFLVQQAIVRSMGKFVLDELGLGMQMEVVADQLPQRFLGIYELAFHFANSMLGNLEPDQAAVIHQNLVDVERTQLAVSESELDDD
jgi:hypothetical protein